MDFKNQIDFYAQEYAKIAEKKDSNACILPGDTYFLRDGSILCIPRGDGDNRFPYGENGFNFWTYASGYIHANEGLFSPFLRASEGQEPRFAVFAGWKGEEEYDVLPLLAVPQLEETHFYGVIRYTVFTKICAYYITEARGIRFALRMFVDEGNHMYFSLEVKNLSSQPQELYISAYLNPYLCNSIYDNSENRWFRMGQYTCEEETDLGRFLFHINEDLTRTLSVTNYGVINQVLTLPREGRLLGQEATTSRYEYVGGIYSSLHSSKALRQGGFDNRRHTTCFNDVAIAGEILKVYVPSSEILRMDMELCYKIHSSDSKECDALIRDLIPEAVDRMVKVHQGKYERTGQNLRGSFGKGLTTEYDGSVLTNFVDYLMVQVEFCSMIKGYVQLSAGSLIGIRDVFQAIEGMLYYKPEQARAKILEAMNYISPSGRCPRQYSLPANDLAMPVMDLRQFIDQGCWVINTITTYLKFTGDFAFLQETCGYYEILDDKRRLVQKSSLRDSVLSHMLRIMDYLMQNQDSETGCVKALYGDWNDALDGLGVCSDGSREFGNGVSVMVTLQFYQNLKDMTELLQKLGDQEELIESYRKVMTSIEQGLQQHAIQRNDKGEHKSYCVGSFQDPDGASRYGLTSNAFWVISGMYRGDRRMKETILEAFDRLDSRFGMKTFEPYFPANTPGVGRIYKLPPGTAENGAAYIHATAFGIMALFMMGEAKRAWEQLMKIFPFTHKQVSCSPYVMPNSYGDNELLNIAGESMQDWQTGSSNVVFKLLVRFVFGFQPEYDGFFLQPAAWLPFEDYQLDITYKKSALHIRYKNRDTGRRCFRVNNRLCTPVYDEAMGIDKLWIDLQELCDDMEIIIED